jgi:hypothetical protein
MHGQKDGKQRIEQWSTRFVSALLLRDFRIQRCTENLPKWGYSMLSKKTGKNLRLRILAMFNSTSKK